MDTRFTSTRICIVVSALLISMSLGCDGDDLPPITDISYLDMAPPLDAQLYDGFGQCVRSDEVCNEVDDDCDGVVDEANDVRVQVFSDPLHCGGCGRVCEGPNATYGCRVGECVIDACTPGYVDYNGDPVDGCETDCIITAGGQELCDGADNDCDGNTDEDFGLESDPQNCGACGNICPMVNSGAPSCIEGTCRIERCETDHHDLNGTYADGCEYECTVRSTADVREYCNGLDDDCDGLADEFPDLHPVQNSCGIDGACGPECVTDRTCVAGSSCGEGGVCTPTNSDLIGGECEVDADCQEIHPGLACIAETIREDSTWTTTRRCVARQHAPVCDGQNGFRCTRGPTWQRGSEIARCDGIDNDCDGRADEDFEDALFLPGAAQQPRPCVAGQGLCQVNGITRCSPDGLGVECSEQPALPQTDRDATCDGIDEDCDGRADEDFQDAVVNVGAVTIFAYEASRPGATADAAGRDPNPDDDITTYVEGRACSRAGVLPWSDVTWREASDACAAANARLCTELEWVRACGGADAQDFPYGPSFRSQNCNGGVYDADPNEAGNQDELLQCGSIQICRRA
jgi:hypothetical protein